MLTAREFAAKTGISYPVIIKWLKSGRIVAEQLSFNVWQIPASQVEKFLRAGNRPIKGRPKQSVKGSKK